MKKLKMKKIKPILTEKSLNDAESGKYTFWVSPNLNKHQIKKLISEAFGVQVDSVATANYKRREKRSVWTRRKTIRPARKKATVVLRGKDKIDLFEGGNKDK